MGATYIVAEAGVTRYQVAEWTTGESVCAFISRVGTRIAASPEDSSYYAKVGIFAALRQLWPDSGRPATRGDGLGWRFTRCD